LQQGVPSFIQQAGSYALDATTKVNALKVALIAARDVVAASINAQQPVFTPDTKEARAAEFLKQMQGLDTKRDTRVKGLIEESNLAAEALKKETDAFEAAKKAASGLPYIMFEVEGAAKIMREALDPATGALTRFALKAGNLGIRSATDLVALSGQGQGAGGEYGPSDQGWWDDMLKQIQATNSITPDRAAALVEAAELGRLRAIDLQTQASTRLTETTNTLRGIFEGLLSSAAQASKNLSDISGKGVADATKPGANGPFEDIYRLQAWIKDKTHGDVAAKAGVSTNAQAEAIVGAFQNGDWLPALQAGLINVEKLNALATTQMQGQGNREAILAELTKQGLSAVNAAKMVETMIPGVGKVKQFPGGETPAKGINFDDLASIKGFMGNTTIGSQSIVVNVGPGAVVVQGEDPQGAAKRVGAVVSKALQSMSTAVDRQDVSPLWGVPGNP
jgi:hypothetical protein